MKAFGVVLVVAGLVAVGVQPPVLDGAGVVSAVAGVVVAVAGALIVLRDRVDGWAS